MSNEFVWNKKKNLYLFELYKKAYSTLQKQNQNQVKSIVHDFVVGPVHKLIQSVNGKCEVKKLNVSYSEDTFTRRKIGKHDTSNPFTHSFGVRELFETKLV